MESKRPTSFSLDTLARAVYFGFSNNPVEKTVRKGDSFFIDYDKDENMVGIELIRVKKVKATITKIVKDTENNLPVAIREKIDNYLQHVEA